ncbi:MAG: DUF2493 domain-containing protein [Hyphomicrobium sp.]|nr:DUF2493 domain-containing protein [Hyphomicrobium sp.]
MKVLVCGDRNYTDYHKIYTYLEDLPEKGTIIIEGGARGVDSLAKRAAEDLGLLVIEYKAHWKLYGKAAGPKRNRLMLQENPDVVFAFHSDLSKSKGTKHMVSIARKAGIKVRLFS